MLNKTRAAGRIKHVIYKDGKPHTTKWLPSPAESGKHAGPGTWNVQIGRGRKKTASELYDERRNKAVFPGDEE